MNRVSDRPVIAMIAAMDRNRVIGANGGLPWHLPADMRHFVQTTRGKPVIMGRRNYEDIGGALPNRHNVILTRDPSYPATGCTVATKATEAIAAAGSADEIMVIGGEQIYRLFLPESQRLYLTYVDAAIGGDTYFPALAVDEWHETKREHRRPDDRNGYAMTFVTLERDG